MKDNLAIQKSLTIRNQDDIGKIRDCIQESTKHTCKEMHKILCDSPPAKVFKVLKFHKIGIEPLNRTPLNVLEQITQTATYLATLDGLEQLRKRHKKVKTWLVNFGTAPGNDIQSGDRTIIAEVFAAVKPANNRKQRKDLKKAESAPPPAKYRYVIYRMDNKRAGESIENGVTVIQLA